MKPPRFDVRSNGRQAALLLAAALAVNAGAYVGLVRPRLMEADRLERESEPRLQQVKDREAEVAAKERFVKAVDTAARDLAALRQDVLSTKRQRMIDVQLELAELATQFSINLERVQYENQVLEDEGLERFAMKVPLKGGYASLRKFLQAVEASDQFLVIEEVALEGQPGDQALELNITLATYFDAPELRQAPVASPARPRAVAPDDEEGA